MKQWTCFLFWCVWSSLSGQAVELSQDTSVREVDTFMLEEEVYEDIPPSRVHIFEGSFSIYNPLDQFKQRLGDDAHYGFSLGYLYQLQKEKPAFVGVEVFHMNLGRFSKNYEAQVGLERLILTGRVSSNALGINGMYRYYIPFKVGRLEPYLEGQLGYKYLYTYLSEAGAFSDDEPYDNFDLLQGDWVITYGGAAGFHFFLSDIYFLNIKTTYHFAVSGEYQTKKEEGLGQIDFPQEAFESVQSTTNLLKIDLGFTVIF